jgi:hypothetical protein
MNQLAMDFVPATRRTDDCTSRQAEARVTASGQRATHCERVLDAIRAEPGSTSAELARYLGMERHEVARRCSDLLGSPEREVPTQAAKGAKRICDVSGRLAVTWHAVESTRRNSHRDAGDTAADAPH